MNKLFERAEEDGIVIVYCRLPMNESLCVQDEDGDIILMDRSLAKSARREKVHLAHEMGHSETGSFYNPYSPFDVRKKHENHADKWAIQELIPEEDLQRAVEHGHCEIWDLADYFDVTEDFMRKALCWYTYGNLAVDAYLPK